jgi:energy-coupling factor transporter transmembrane protein EcfT
MLFQFDDMIRRQIYKKELNTENKLSDKVEYFAITFFLILLVVSYIIKKEVNIFILIILLVILLYFILSKIKLFNYLENPTSIFLFIIGLTMFGSQLALKIDRDIEHILKGEKEINISLNDEYKGFEDLSFITMNSNYIFLWDKKEKKSIVLPLSSISNLNSIEIKK